MSVDRFSLVKFGYQPYIRSAFCPVFFEANIYTWRASLIYEGLKVLFMISLLLYTSGSFSQSMSLK